MTNPSTTRNEEDVLKSLLFPITSLLLISEDLLKLKGILTEFGVIDVLIKGTILLLLFAFCVYMTLKKSTKPKELSIWYRIVFSVFSVFVLLWFVFNGKIYLNLFIPLPDKIYGVLHDESGTPLEFYQIRIIDSHGMDITDGTWETDRDGYFYVRCTKKIPGNSSIVFIHSKCNYKFNFLVNRHEIINDRYPDAKPLYQYTISKCDYEKN